MKVYSTSYILEVVIALNQHDAQAAATGKGQSEVTARASKMADEIAGSEYIRTGGDWKNYDKITFTYMQA